MEVGLGSLVSQNFPLYATGCGEHSLPLIFRQTGAYTFTQVSLHHMAVLAGMDR